MPASTMDRHRPEPPNKRMETDLRIGRRFAPPSRVGSSSARRSPHASRRSSRASDSLWPATRAEAACRDSFPKVLSELELLAATRRFRARWPPTELVDGAPWATRRFFSLGRTRSTPPSASSPPRLCQAAENKQLHTDEVSRSDGLRPTSLLPSRVSCETLCARRVPAHRALRIPWSATRAEAACRDNLPMILSEVELTLPHAVSARGGLRPISMTELRGRRGDSSLWFDEVDATLRVIANPLVPGGAQHGSCTPTRSFARTAFGRPHSCPRG